MTGMTEMSPADLRAMALGETTNTERFRSAHAEVTRRLQHATSAERAELERIRCELADAYEEMILAAARRQTAEQQSRARERCTDDRHDWDDQLQQPAIGAEDGLMRSGA